MTDKELNYRLTVIETMLEELLRGSNIEKRYECPICNNKLHYFLPFGEITRNNAQCPVCKSLERHRGMWKWINSELGEVSIDNSRILHFAPERCLYDQLAKDKTVEYWPVDYNEFFYGIRKKIDIQSIDFEDSYFDIAICNHVLEHIPSDTLALKEIYRVLNNNGVAIISVPLAPGLKRTLENPEYNTDELRLKHYGQKDHVRKYGEDIVDRIKSAGFEVEIICPGNLFGAEESKKNGIISTEVFFLCKKISIAENK